MVNFDPQKIFMDFSTYAGIQIKTSKYLKDGEAIRNGNSFTISENNIYRFYFKMLEFDEALEASVNYAKNKIDNFVRCYNE